MTQNIYETPNSDVSSDSGEAVSLTPKEILLSFKGRIRRATYWKYLLSMFVAIFVLMFLLATLGINEDAIAGVFVILYIPLIWASLAIQAKRWHDRDKSAWFILISLIPVIGPIWAFVENGCLAGTDGANRFGPPEA
ncbi:DUF805 domain-containing protein [Marinagarivorans cellulosilyticus]|uniref:DUF805 domain-containing protein n=1 Tax=Marinagarivorans cellulosilyticus TaxID=2721545 RepID=A0AAN1WEP5_9GAMM|nr:DUF805 domain-containing protein [Marinagarivorans cellulosilyticus]BCD96202.1 hypothetical protein MARGE09_P0401 [Marinagarivorans cellulosilyticus]